jgi:two-component system NtrC family sensor kinase
VEEVRVFDKQGVIIYSATESDIGTQVDLQAEACVSCHGEATPLESVPMDSRYRIFERESGERILGLINPIENAPECFNAACHAHPAEQRILGVLDITMSMADTDHRIAVVRRQSVIAAAVMALIAGIFSAAFIMRMVRRPVGQLIEGAERISGGDLDTEIEIQSTTEIGQLTDSFNKMTRDLRSARQELTDWSDRLEIRLREKTEELSRTQQQVAHMDKMASLGKLAATVAHELNNPLSGILNYAKLVKRTIEESEEDIPEREELERQLTLIQKEASRSGSIVKNLLIFARPGGVELALQSLHQILDRSEMLIRHHLEMADITLEMEQMEVDDQIICDADQLEQALVALLVNAVEAMPEGGTLRLKTEAINDSVKITIADSGVGIPEEALSHIFEPFYTSKDQTDGAGLGLAVVYGIVQRHGGEIDVESEVGTGTTFRITIPRKPPADKWEE